MIHKIKLKNSKEVLLLDDKGYELLTTHKYCKQVNLIENIRRHSTGNAVFQKNSTRKKRGGKPGEKTTNLKTIYIHRFLAEQLKSKEQTKIKKWVTTLNGNKLDCRLENIVWKSRSVVLRNRKSSSKTGYTGVYVENNRYRAVIFDGNKSCHIGVFPTPEEAAMAYNKKSKELFGEDGKINIIRKSK